MTIMVMLASFPPDVRVVGTNVSLRPWELHDLSHMPALFDDPEVARWTALPSPFDLTAARARIARSHRLAAGGIGLQLAVTLPGEERVPRGEIGLMRDADEPDTAELGYAIGPAHRGMGLASGSLALCAELALRELGFERVILRIDPENAPSLGVARSAGFVPADAPLFHRPMKGRLHTLVTWTLPV
ncbi:hypothetical protein GCM10027160_41530 [Streptomyces calidiresistens]|uniref:GNAT family N-acetyltransferase n=2 Tax=Streptomyces calidiresistens TaxID=1485586 RepID=A0A7W3T3X8_9ACTN|nr:GNAT family N-acetyltransferase [Streptomyces calidiresistens]